MPILVLSHADVVSLLPMHECIEVVAQALAGLARGEAYQPLRTIVWPPGYAGVIGLMPAARAAPTPVFGLKAINVFPGNPARGLDAHQGVVLLSSGEDGTPLALLDASAVTAIRTAAVSGLATRLLARDDAGDLALIGAGVQARTHLSAMARVRSLRRVRIAARRSERARALAADVRYPFAVEAVESVEAAVRGADLVVTVTSSVEPVLKREWIAAGTHVNAVGSSIASAREIDTPTMAASRLFVDRRESTLAESGDYLFAAREGAIGPDHIQAEIGEVLVGARPGRTSRDEITLFESLGLAIEDLAAAEHVYRKALERGVGTRADF